MKTIRSRRSRIILAAALLAAAVIVFLLNICVGSSKLPLSEVLDVIFGGNKESTSYLIVTRIRLPRALSTLAGGASLAIAGLLLQTFFSNPIVEPYVLGISSGATLFAGLVILGGFTFGFKRITPMLLFAGAFAGALLVMTVVLFASRKVKSVVTLLIIGLMAGYVCGAGTTILTAFAEKEQLANFTMWSLGSFAGFTWEQIRVLYLITVPSLLCTLMLAKPLNALNAGEKYALSMGINVRRIRSILIVLSSVLTSAITAFSGPVSFIGLAVPHICRILLRTSDNRILLPVCIAAGGLMAGICDFTARNLLSPIEIPLGAVTAVFGAPLVVFLLTRKGDANFGNS